MATGSVNQPLIKESDRLRLTRASVATESVNQPLIKESDRLRLTRPSVATGSVNQPLIKELARAGALLRQPKPIALEGDSDFRLAHEAGQSPIWRYRFWRYRTKPARSA